MKLPFVSRKKYESSIDHAVDAFTKLLKEIQELRQELEKYKTPRDEKGRFAKR